MTEGEPNAIHYFRKAAEDMEDDSRITMYYLAKGLLRLAESLAAQGSKEGVEVTGNIGACQGSCRLSYALLRFSVKGSRAALIAASRSGFKVTTVIGDQWRVGPDQRRGCRALAS